MFIAVAVSSCRLSSAASTSSRAATPAARSTGRRRTSGLRSGMDSPGGPGHPGPGGGGALPAGAAAMIGRMHATIDRMQANTDFFLAHELRQFSSFVSDIDALQAVRDRIILAVSRRPAAVLAGRLGGKTVAFPGGHAGYATDPADFAVRLAGVLAGRNLFNLAFLLVP